jgi:hypothetical protein
MRCGLPNAIKVLTLLVSVAVAADVQISKALAWEYSGGGMVTAASSTSSSAAAQKRHLPTTGGAALGYSPVRRYFVEFRARNAASYGHMYVMYGEANERHEVIRSEIAGFFPAGDRRDCENCSVYNWTIGHVLPVPSEIGASDGDLEEQYVLARFRVWIDAAQYKRLVAYINQRKANRGPWNAFLNNCVTFGRDVAVFMNLKVPFLMSVGPTVVMYPKDVVHGLAEANGVYKDQGALKDAPSSLMIEASPKASEKAAAGAKAASSSPKRHLANQRDEPKAESSSVH